MISWLQYPGISKTYGFSYPVIVRVFGNLKGGELEFGSARLQQRLIMSHHVFFETQR